jgi:hypothetical protein
VPGTGRPDEIRPASAGHVTTRLRHPDAVFHPIQDPPGKRGRRSPSHGTGYAPATEEGHNHSDVTPPVLSRRNTTVRPPARSHRTGSSARGLESRRRASKSLVFGDLLAFDTALARGGGAVAPVVLFWCVVVLRGAEGCGVPGAGGGRGLARSPVGRGQPARRCVAERAAAPGAGRGLDRGISLIVIIEERYGAGWPALLAGGPR